MERFDGESSARPTMGGQAAEEPWKLPTEQVSIYLPQTPAPTARARARRITVTTVEAPKNECRRC
jgi:hypothetical protein